ncbi:non-ribosomal peptide synthetase [Mucilaginibacter rubeus]|uniref:Amino acid adenylation domain-containing protein n=1 Tax=Mucilaginibacter rubeus TaxID=2027860 RepID=A0A5C1I3Q9_9SPHI|nr:non-ribosomal peptide synthetase [Mucilaginibacter rubeus]QEM12509.1 amino acid adenylation domain-containing protein [Mucilaginibacter rubeus]
MQYQNLCDLIRNRANTHHVGVTFINGMHQESFLSYAGLYEASLNCLGALQAAGLKKGDELVFQVDNNQNFIITFWACILGGILPVPLATDNGHDHRMKVFRIWPVLNSPSLLISATDADKLQAFAIANGLADIYEQMSSRLIYPDRLSEAAQAGKIEQANENDIAFIQFSSGSTGTPKGVVLTHRNLLTNVEAIKIASGYTPADSLLSWMPLTHDMGLIGFHISPVFSGLNHYIIPTNVFIRRPAIWFDAATRYKATVLSSPNFGYEYLMKSLKQETYNWDLSNIRIIYNGAEPISARICSDFISTFKQYGLPFNSICPVYGLAENSLAVSVSKIDDEVLSLKLSRTQLGVGEQVSIISVDNEGAVFVNLGKVVPYCTVQIADEAGNNLPAGTIGFVMIKGESVTSGYYNNKTATDSAINNNGWLNTGDIGFIKDDCVYLTGRSKDILFCNGQNFYAHDIEALAQDLAGIELNKIAIGGSFNPQTQREEIIAFVVFKGKPEVFADTVKTVKSYVAKKTGIDLTHVLPVKSIPRTTSGKIQRYKLMEQYHHGDFNDVIQQLDAINHEDSVSQTQYISSLSETEQQILAIWQQILKGRIVDPANDFFENGGNSLKAVALQLQILKQWNADIDVASLYQNSTLAGIAQLIGNGAYKQYIPYRQISLEVSEAVYPLSAFQKGIYYHWTINPLSVAYNVPVALLVDGNADPLVINNALKALVGRHAGLRSRFVPGAEPACIIKEDININIAEIDLQVADWFDRIKSYVKPFNLHNDTLFRFTLLKISKARHILLLDFHHIVADGVSVNNFVQELLTLIDGGSLIAATQYRDYIAYEAERNKTVRPKAVDYWAEKTSGDWPVLNLPADHARPPHFDYRGERLFFKIDDLQRRRLTMLAKQQNCTLHVLLFTLYKILLYKYTGQSDIVIGIPVAVRNHPDFLDVFGMMVNNLAIRQPLNSNISVIETLRIEAHNMAQALVHKEFAFDEQVKLAAATRDTSRNQLFDTMFVFQNMVDGLMSTKNLSVTNYAFDPGISKYDLSLEIFDDGTLLKAGFEFCGALFNRDTIGRMANHFNNIINEVLAHPAQTVGKLSILGNDEITRLARYNTTQAVYPHGSTIQLLFEDQVFKTPDSVALIFNDEQLSYAALYARVKVLAMELQAAGLAPGAVAGIYLRRSPDLVVSILAVLITGATYLPLDTELPIGRVAFMLKDSRCGLLISNKGLSTTLLTENSLAGFNIFYVDSDHNTKSKIAAYPELNDAAYIIYTSGTTGNPKGVVIEQPSLINYITWAAKAYLKPGPEVFAFCTSVSFDLTITSIFTPLVTGNAIIIYDDAVHETIIETLINDNRATIAKLTPSHLRMLSSLYSKGMAIKSSIKTFVVGGEQLPGSLCSDIYDLFERDIDIYNEYGPTEATVGCMIHQYNPQEKYDAVPIGVPAANVRLYLLDDDFMHVPAGVPGQLYIAGDCLAKGYLFNQEATAAKFVPDPFFEGVKMYRSGDRGRLLPDGKMEYLGRLDSQVKINGYRIELAEIEQVLKQYPGISEAIVNVDKNASHPLISAWYISNTDIDSNELTAFLTSRLPYYMLPASVTRIYNVPLTSNHKIDFAALAVLSAPAPTTEVITPKDGIELSIIDIWKEVLNQTNLSTDANFFQMGGDSIKAFQISSRLLDLQINITARDILICQTIDQLMMRIKTDNLQAGNQQLPLAGDLELPPAASWFMARNFKYPGHYNQTLLFNLHRQPDVSLFEQAFDQVVKNHDGLRLNFDFAKNKLFYNHAHIENRFSIAVMAGKHLQSLSDVLMHLEQNTQNEFCIQTDLLLRGTLFNLGNGTSILAVSAHHLVIDGVSWRILLEELYRNYTALEQGSTPVVHSKSGSLNDWQTARNKRKTSAAYKAAVEGWTDNDDQQVSLLVDMPVRTQINHDTFKMKWVLNTIDMAYLLKDASTNFSFDTGLLLFGSFLQMMQQWTGNNHFFITNEYHGRDFDGFNFSKTIGWFTAIYPSLWKWEGDDLVEKLNYLKKQTSINSSKAVDYSIWRYNNKPGIHDVETAELQFNFLGEFGAELSNDLFSYSNKSPLLQSHPDNPMTAKIEANTMVINEKLHVEIIADSKVYLPATVCELMDIWASALQQMIADLKNNNLDAKGLQLSNVGLSQSEINDLFN